MTPDIKDAKSLNLPKYDKELLKHGSPPLLGSCPAFPFEDFRDEIKKSFRLQDVSFKASDFSWISLADFTESQKNPFEALGFDILGTNASFFLGFEKEQKPLLFAELLSLKLTDYEGLDKSFKEAFSSFLVGALLDIYSSLPFEKDLSFVPSKKTFLDEKNLLTREIELTLSSKTFRFYFMLTKDAVEFAKNKWSQKGPLSEQNHALQKNLSFTLRLLCGGVSLKQTEYDALSPGDLLLLDTLTISSESKKGVVLGEYKGNALFSAQYKPGKIKIIETSLNSYSSEEKQDE